MSSALVAVRKTPISVRYYEAAASRGREALMQQLVFVLGQLEDVPVEMPAKGNCSSLMGEELTAHYIEAEMREMIGEARGCLGWPPLRSKKARGHLKGLRTTVEAARKKWCIEENAKEAQARHLSEVMVAKVLKSEERRKAFEARWKEAKARNQWALDEGTFAGAIVPIGYRPPEPRSVRKAAEEMPSEKKTFLLAMHEAPDAAAPA